jgi:hypothetical protein
MEPEGSLPSSQELSTCTYPEPDQSSPQHSLLSSKVLNNEIRLYNKLPERIRVLGNFRSFKNEVKSLMIAKTLYSIDEFLNSCV